MKTIGIIGGIDPPSTIVYYKLLNEGVQSILGEYHSAKIILTSLDCEDVKKFRIACDTEGEGKFYAQEAKRLEQAGADCVIIASNTSHKNAPYIMKEISIPLLHLAEATAKHIYRSGLKNIGLLGTVYTMEEDFYKSYLISEGLNVIIPEAEDRAFIGSTIYNELIKGIVRPEVNAEFIRIILKLQKSGAEGIILGCTDLTFLDLKSINIPLFDTIKIHVEAALKFSLT